MTASSLLRLGVLLTACLTTPVRAAARCPLPPGGTARLDAIDPALRIAFIQQRLQAGRWNALLWSWGWGGASVASAATNFTLAGLATDPDVRYDRVVGGISGLVGPAAKLISPLKIMADSRALDARLEQPGALSDPCAVLAEAEDYLRRDALGESRSFLLNHLGTVLVALGGGLALFAGGPAHYKQAVIQMSATLVVGEVQAWTMPTAAMSEHRSYLAGDLGGERTSWLLVPVVGPDAFGLQLHATF